MADIEGLSAVSVFFLVRLNSYLFSCTSSHLPLPVLQEEVARIAESRKKRSFKKFTFRGIDLDKLLDLKPDELLPLVRMVLSFLFVVPPFFWVLLAVVVVGVVLLLLLDASHAQWIKHTLPHSSHPVSDDD